MTAPRLLLMGGAVVDYVYRIERLPDLGDEAVARSFDQLPGGGFNMMNAAARAGMRVAYGGGHGTGVHGDCLRAALRDAGIEILQSVAAGIDSGCCAVMVTDDAERSFVSWPGAEGILDPDRLAALHVERTDWVFASGYTLSHSGSRDALAAWIEALPKAVPLILDPSQVVRQIPDTLLSRVLRRMTWVTCTSAEAMAITGPDDPKSMAERLLTRHCPAAAGVIVRTGAGGCVLKQRDRPSRLVQGFPVEAIDTNGAGDVHVGAFIAALAGGAQPLDAVLYANAAAAIAVTRHGGSNAPHDEEIRNFLHSAGQVAPELDR